MTTHLLALIKKLNPYKFNKENEVLVFRRIRHNLQNIFRFIFPLLITFIIWEIVVRAAAIPQTAVPAPSSIAMKFFNLTFERDVMIHHFLLSIFRLTVGFLLGIVLGILSGSVLAINPILKETFLPSIKLLLSVPTIAWIPLLLVTMGLGDRTVITAVFLGSFFEITFSTIRGFSLVNRNLIYAAEMTGVRGIKLYLNVMLPASMVSIITGLRLGIGYSWRALVGGEMLSAMIDWGVGKFIFQSRFWNDTNAMFVGLIVIGLSSLAVDHFLLDWIAGKTIVRWGMVDRR